MVGRSPCALNRISRIAPLGLRTCSTTAPGYIGIVLYKSGRFTVLLIARRGFSQALIGQKNNDRIAVTIWQVLDRLGQPISQGSRGDPWIQGSRPAPLSPRTSMSLRRLRWSPRRSLEARLVKVDEWANTSLF